MNRTRLALAGCLLLLLAVPANANGIDGDTEKGQAFAQENCARCHAIGISGDSPLPPAPPLRELSERYKLESLYEAFAEGIAVGHSAMPEFVLEPDQIGDLLSYIQSLPDTKAE